MFNGEYISFWYNITTHLKQVGTFLEIREMETLEQTKQSIQYHTNFSDHTRKQNHTQDGLAGSSGNKTYSAFIGS